LQVTPHVHASEKSQCIVLSGEFGKKLGDTECQLFRLAEKLLVARRHLRERGCPANRALELAPLLSLIKSDPVDHGGDAVHQVHVDIARRLRKFKGFRDKLRMRP
jgi:hypothetical protein